MGKRELNEQREHRQTCMSSAVSRVKKSKAQYIQANKDWLEAKSKEEGIMCMIVPMALSHTAGLSHILPGRHALCPCRLAVGLAHWDKNTTI